MFSQDIGFFKQNPVGDFGNNLDLNTNTSCWIVTPSTGATPTDLINWTNTSGFTVEYWVYTTAWPGALSPGPGNGNGFNRLYWSFGPAQLGRLVFYFDPTGTVFNNNYIQTNNNALSLNTWHNIAAVCTTSGSNTTVTLYIDGVRQSIQLNSGSFADSQTISGGTYDTSYPFGLGKLNNNFLTSFVNNLRVSNINRYVGPNYSVATSPYNVDSYTQFLSYPTGSNGSTTIPFVTNSSSGNMFNTLNLVTVTNTHYNHS